MTEQSELKITEPLRLAVGSHVAGTGRGCAMNVISWEMGDLVITDVPETADPFLAVMVQSVNDSICMEGESLQMHGGYCRVCSEDWPCEDSSKADGAHHMEATWSTHMLCQPCAVKVLELAHRTVGTRLPSIKNEAGITDTSATLKRDTRVWLQILEKLLIERRDYYLGAKNKKRKAQRIEKVLSYFPQAEKAIDEGTVDLFLEEYKKFADRQRPGSDAVQIDEIWCLFEIMNEDTNFVDMIMSNARGDYPLELHPRDLSHFHHVIDLYEEVTGCHAPDPDMDKLNEALRKMAVIEEKVDSK